MAIVKNNNILKRYWRPDTGNVQRTRPINGLNGDRSLVCIGKISNQEVSDTDKTTPIYEVKHQGEMELRAPNGVVGTLSDLVIREVGGTYANQYLQIHLEDQDSNLVEVIELGTVKSTVVRSLISCLRSVEGSLYGKKCLIKSYANKKGPQTYTNAIIELDDIKLQWKYTQNYLNDNYPISEFVMTDQNQPKIGVDGKLVTKRDAFWENELNTLITKINDEFETNNPKATPEQELTTEDIPTPDKGELPF